MCFLSVIQCFQVRCVSLVSYMLQVSWNRSDRLKLPHWKSGFKRYPALFHTLHALILDWLFLIPCPDKGTSELNIYGVKGGCNHTYQCLFYLRKTSIGQNMGDGVILYIRKDVSSLLLEPHFSSCRPFILVLVSWNCGFNEYLAVTKIIHLWSYV